MPRSYQPKLEVFIAKYMLSSTSYNNIIPFIAPSKPREVVAIPISPNSVRVQWLQPINLNGINVKYSVHWLPDNTFMSIEQDNQTGSHRYTADILSLAPNTNYTFAVGRLSYINKF